MPPKRNIRALDDNLDAIQLVNLDEGWMERLLELDQENLAQVLGHIANRGNISNRMFKRVRTTLSSFSSAKWAAFAESAHLPSDPSVLNLLSFSTPYYRLPPQFHEAIIESSWRAQDVFREKTAQTREEAGVRLLDSYIIPILALFHGRIVDKPEQTMPETEYSTGGEVEHEIFMIGGVLFVIMELKFDRFSPDNLAQLFLEFLSAAKSNKGADFEGLRIYGLLTDLTQFRFYSYNPQDGEFCQDVNFIVGMKRGSFASDMIDVTNKIFGLVLFAFTDGLRAIAEKSNSRAAKGDLSSPSSAPIDRLAPKSPRRHKAPKRAKLGVRASTTHWELALKFAEESCAKFEENPTSIEDMERISNEAVELLTHSIGSIPRFSTFTGTVDSPSLADLKGLARNIVSEKHEALFKLAIDSSSGDSIGSLSPRTSL